MDIEAIAETLTYGTHRVVCPICLPERKKKNIKDMVLTKDSDGYMFYCHHCGAHDGVINRDTQMPARELVKEPLTSAEKFLKERGISLETAERAGIYQTTAYFRKLGREAEAIAFPYKSPKGVEYAAKLRCLEVKDFSCNGAPQTFFGEFSSDELIIVEGEMDALAMMEAGIQAVSIPNGANEKATKDTAFRFLEHHEKQISAATKVTLFLDADGPGKATAEELARRIGRSKCFHVQPPEGAKDANDILLAGGVQALIDCLSTAEPWPVEGLHGVNHYMSEVSEIWDKGLAKGAGTGFNNVDQIYSVVPGQLSIVTGFPGSGKSEFVDQLMVHLAASEGWRFAICSFENEPRLHIAKLVQKYIGEPFFNSPLGRMTEKQRDAGLAFARKHFSFLHDTSGDLTDLDSIIDRLKVAVLRYGIKGAVIDPYNYIARPKDMQETQWVSEMLSRVRSFAQAHGVHVWFIAHPQKLPPSEDRVPKGNDISGSAAWWAKADMGVTVHRPDPAFSTDAEVHVWKVRFAWTGKQGIARLYYNEKAGQLVEPGATAIVRKF